MVIARRLSAEEKSAAETAGLEYPIFMAVTEKIGHDKRGNVLYRRTETGEDVLVTRQETVTEIDPSTGDEVLRTVQIQDRQIDDELPDAATSYLRWLGEQK